MRLKKQSSHLAVTLDVAVRKIVPSNRTSTTDESLRPIDVLMVNVEPCELRCPLEYGRVQRCEYIERGSIDTLIMFLNRG